MAGGFEFPAFLKLEMSGDQSAEAAFVARVEQMMARGQASIRNFAQEAKGTLDAALATSRTDTGSLNLNVDGLKAAAAAQQVRAVAAREVADAALAAARAEGFHTKEMREAYVAANALATAEEEAARATLQHATVASRVQAELNKSASAVDFVAQASRRGTDAHHMAAESTRGLRQASLQAGQQLQDMAISLYSGQNASVVFAQQLPQLSFALTSLEGSANKSHDRIGRFASFLSGPWGLAVGLGVGVLGSLIASLFDSSDAAEETSKAHQTLADRLNLTKNSFDKVVEASRAYNDEMEHAGQTALQAARAASVNAKANYEEARSIRAKLEARLELAKAEYLSGDDRYRRLAGSIATGSIEALLARNQEEMNSLDEAVLNTAFELGDELAKIQTDPIAAITEQFVNLRDELRGSTDDTTELTRKLAELRRQEASAKDRIREAEKATRSGGRGSRGDSLSEDYGAALLSRAQSFSGLREDRNASQLQSLFREANVNINPDMIAWCAAFVNAVLATENLPGTGSLAARSFLDYGKSVDTPEMGDIVVLRRGSDPNAGHVGFYAGDAGEGKIKVTGGNQSDSVSTATFSTRDVLGYRRAPRPDQAHAEAQKILDKQLSDADQLLSRLGQINARFGEQPSLFQQTDAAATELDAVIADMERRLADENLDPLLAEKFRAAREEAEAAKETIADALIRPFEQMREESERRMQIDRLLLSGREEESAVLNEIWRLESQIGDLTAEQRAEVEAIVRAEEAHIDALQRAQDLQSSYLDATRSVRSELEAVFAGEGDIGNFGKIFKRLQSRVMVEEIFGDTLRGLDDYVKRETGIEASVNHFESGITTAGDASIAAARSFYEAARIASDPGYAAFTREFDAVLGAGPAAVPGSAANDNATGGAVAPELVVTADRSTVNGLTPAAYFDEMTARLVEPMLAGLDETFGTQFFAQLSGAVSGAFYGLATGGEVGGVLGGAKGLFDEFGEDLFGKDLAKQWSDDLKQALGGAQTGQMVAGLGDMLGLNMSNTGSQIGGAIGSFGARR